MLNAVSGGFKRFAAPLTRGRGEWTEVSLRAPRVLALPFLELI